MIESTPMQYSLEVGCTIAVKCKASLSCCPVKPFLKPCYTIRLHLSNSAGSASPSLKSSSVNFLFRSAFNDKSQKPDIILQ